jgi:NADPH-dependent 2,4-dienoyl-CoA reductase/sulfur reductase-like enzyme
VSKFELVIVGGGLASARAIEAYREVEGKGAVVLLSRDAALPYHRPPLSKRYLRGEVEASETLVEPAEFYDKHGVALALETDVARVDPSNHAVETRDGKRLSYRKLLIATGAVPRRLEVEGADLPGVFTLRTLKDATAIREAAREVRDAVIVGGGFIGIEVAASLAELGVAVSLIDRSSDLFAQLGSPEVSDHLVSLYRQRGVEVIQGAQIRAFRGRSVLDTVELHTGEQLGARLAVVGIGVDAAVRLLDGSGVAIGNGVIVNERFETNVPDVYAVGDVACFYDPLYGRQRRIEHWSNADYQGREVGKILAGADGGYDTVSTYFTESFGLTLKVFGDTSQHDDRVARGTFAHSKTIVFYLANSRLVGTLLAGQDQETEKKVKQLIRTRAAVNDPRALADESLPIEEALAATPDSRIQ